MSKSILAKTSTTSILPSINNVGQHIILSKEDLFNILSLVHLLAQCTKDTLAPRDTRVGQIHNLQNSITYLSEICESPKDTK